MNRKLIPIVTMLVFLVLFIPTSLAQSTQPTTGPDSDIVIVCDNDYYIPDIYGHINIYCDITNFGGSTKNEKVGSIFDDALGEEVALLDVYFWNGSDWESIKPNMNKDKPNDKRTRQLSNQNIQTQSGQTTQVWFRMKVPMPSSGKFDMLYGEYALDPWWNATWQYKYNFTKYGHIENLTNYPINFTMNTQNLIATGKMKSDCSDVWILNGTEDGNFSYFPRDCNTTHTEFWLLDNFTVGINNTYYVYYGNPSATNTFADPYDIVYEWIDFNNATAFNESGEWVYRKKNETWNVPILNITDGVARVQTTDSAGNMGYYFWRKDQSINSSEGILIDVEYWYNSYTGNAWGYKNPITIRNKDQYPLELSAYGYVTGNHTTVLNTFHSGLYDFSIRSEYGNSTDIFNSGNTSGLYITDQIWNREIMTFDPTDLRYRMYINYSSPNLQEMIFDKNFTINDNLTVSWDFLENYLTYENTLEYGCSDGGSNGVNFSVCEYNYIFARKYDSREPLVMIGSEIPLDNSSLIVNYTTPTPVNGSTINTSNLTINITSNKTIESCVLELNGNNESMTLNPLYCSIDKNLIDGYYTYTVYVQDYWTFINMTDERAFTINTSITPPTPPVSHLPIIGSLVTIIALVIVVFVIFLILEMVTNFNLTNLVITLAVISISLIIISILFTI